jgi:hypothetical protein
MSRDDLLQRGRRTWVASRVATRRLDPRARQLPDVVIVGGQRCGTTSLYRHLAGHPLVRQPLRKEVQYLSLHWDRGLAWYRGHFPVAAPGSRTLEASPYYLFHPDAPRRAAAVLPDARFIALLREPSARAISHHAHNRRNGLETLSLDEALEAEHSRVSGLRAGTRAHRAFSYIGRGRYAEQLRRWHDAVGDRLLVVLSEDLFDRPAMTLPAIYDFCGLAPVEPHVYLDHPLRYGPAPTVTDSARRRLRDAFVRPNLELAELLNRDLAAWGTPVARPGPSQVA